VLQHSPPSAYPKVHYLLYNCRVRKLNELFALCLGFMLCRHIRKPNYLLVLCLGFMLCRHIRKSNYLFVLCLSFLSNLCAVLILSNVLMLNGRVLSALCLNFHFDRLEILSCVHFLSWGVTYWKLEVNFLTAALLVCVSFVVYLACSLATWCMFVRYVCRNVCGDKFFDCCTSCLCEFCSILLARTVRRPVPELCAISFIRMCRALSC